MVHKVTLRHFKRFREDSFDIFDTIILAGPNNSGKSSLLQAIAVWNLALKRWLIERGPESGSKAKQRIGVAITRKDFTAIPLREMNLLWTDRSTALSKEELNEEQKLGTPRKLRIELRGRFPNKEWSLAFDFTYRYPDLIHVKPSNETPIEPILKEIKSFQVIHVPPFSGIGVEETRYDPAYQEFLIGQGKPGDILRNLLLEVYRDKQEEWSELCRVIQETFGYNLLPPEYEGRPFIVCEYQPLFYKKVQPKLDISSAGSGFLQVLMLLGFFYARPASILLLDEPDAHLHVILQKQVYDRLRWIARNRGCQLLIATHSEVLIDSTSPDRIVSFLDHPHKLSDDTQRDQVREALKRVTSLDMLLAEQSPGILYVEGETDLNLLREWARALQHPTYEYFSKKPLFHCNQGSHPRESRSHYFALKAFKRDIRGALILDRDNRNLPSHEVSAEGLTIIRWDRYEVENYLINPNALTRFVRGVSPDLFTMASAERGLEYLKRHLPPPIFENPLVDDLDYFRYTPSSKTLLPGFFEASGLPLTKNEYYQIAAQMKPEEIPIEVKEKLDIIYQCLGLSLTKTEGE